MMKWRQMYEHKVICGYFPVKEFKLERSKL